jgi:acyl transferase domain-containing protein
MMKECPVIIGMACRVPGATNPTKLWENIVAQKDLQRPMPKERFNIDAFYHPDENNKGTVCRSLHIERVN